MKLIYKVAIIIFIIASFYQQKEVMELTETSNKPKTENQIINIVLPKSSFGELEQIPKNHRAIVVAIAMTESCSSYIVKHPDKNTKGIGGIKTTQWCLKSDINSLQAIDEIITKLEEQDKTTYEIIKFYKGAKKNLKSTEQCYDLYLRLKNIL
jgi:hypothetical protein